MGLQIFRHHKKKDDGHYNLRAVEANLLRARREEMAEEREARATWQPIIYYKGKVF